LGGGVIIIGRGRRPWGGLIGLRVGLRNLNHRRMEVYYFYIGPSGVRK